MLSTTNQKMSLAVTFLPSLFLSGSAISSRLVRRFGTRTLGVTVGILVSTHCETFTFLVILIFRHL